ncbi:pyridoxal kinase PdxY [Rothia sp. ZJ1223]|uniref:pyridoxal kinase PdxY n=1 Tax=Rothia sp. ZJ1223 TaxID=2811098 RepID=UPI00195D4E14|nr:pyridoxal kinase PdxY [Rothia sp. ZJ1223]MBM7050863.1 pyridoxal kinase PdxY [Rothia sp. ZJ1223]
MRILSIQSAVAYGHVGNSAAVFPLQRMGHEVMPVNTVLFSNHTGYGTWRGPLVSGDDVREIVTGIEERGGLDDTALVISGYQGGSSIGDAILDAVAKARAKNPKVLYSCDPVLGNATSGCFVSPEVQELIRDRVIQHADIITPNQFELGFITNTSPETLDDVFESVAKAQEIGPKTVLVTSVQTPDTPENFIQMLAVSGDEAWLITTDRLPLKANGSGDVTQALFASHFASGKTLQEALELTTASVYELLRNTLASGQRELQLIESQESYVAPSQKFTAERVR